MTTELRLMLEATDGALLRALGLIEGRGHSLRAVSARTCEDGQELCLEVDTRGRCAEVLARQLAQLCDVREVWQVHAAAISTRPSVRAPRFAARAAAPVSTWSQP